MELDGRVVAELRELGGEELVHQLFQTFIDHAPVRLGGLREATGTGNLEELARVFHSLRSSTAMLGARELSKLAGELEAMADAGATREVLERVPEFEERFAALLATLEEALARTAG